MIQNITMFFVLDISINDLAYLLNMNGNSCYKKLNVYENSYL